MTSDGLLARAERAARDDTCTCTTNDPEVLCDLPPVLRDLLKRHMEARGLLASVLDAVDKEDDAHMQRLIDTISDWLEGKG
jgi:hypothetical protein